MHVVQSLKATARDGLLLLYRSNREFHCECGRGRNTVQHNAMPVAVQNTVF